MPKPIIYHISLDGAAQVNAELDSVTQRFKAGNASIGEMRDTQRTATQTARVYNNEQRISHNLWLAQHSNIRRAGEAMGAFSRLTGVALTAMNAINLAQIAFNTQSARQLEFSQNVRQAERELSLAIRRGGSTQEELSKMTDEVELAKAKAKEFNEELSRQKMSNLFTFGAAIAHLGSSFGSIITRSPDIVNLFRRIGGSFGGTPSVTGGGPRAPGGTGSFSRGGGGGFGPPVVAPGVGGQCMEICNKSQTGIGAAVSTGVGSRLRTIFQVAIPVIITGAATVALYAIVTHLEQIKDWLDNIFTALVPNLNVQVVNWPNWMRNDPRRQPSQEARPVTAGGSFMGAYGAPGSAASVAISAQGLAGREKNLAEFEVGMLGALHGLSHRFTLLGKTMEELDKKATDFKYSLPGNKELDNLLGFSSSGGGSARGGRIAVPVFGSKGSAVSGGIGAGVGIGSRTSKGYASGGLLSEPVTGWGISGRQYSFAENGPEMIVPANQMGRSQGGGNIGSIGITIINNTGDNIEDKVERAVRQILRQAGFGT